MAYLLAQVMPDDAEYVDALQGFCDSYLAPFRTVPHTANGLAYPYHGGFPSWHCMRGAALMTAEHVLGSRAHVLTTAWLPSLLCRKMSLACCGI